MLVCLKNDSYSVTEGGDVTVGIQINQEAETSFNVILSTSPGTATGKFIQMHAHRHAHTHTYKRAYTSTHACIHTHKIKDVML